MKNRSTILGMTVSLLAVAACSGNVETKGTGGQGTGGAATGGTTATGGVGGTGGTMLPPCEVKSVDMMPPYTPFDCPALSKPCGDAHYIDLNLGAGPSVPHFDDPAAPTCILQKLRDRVPSMLTFSGDLMSPTDGQYTYTETIFVIDPDHGVSNWSQAMDLDETFGTRNRQLLQPASYFDACLAETDPAKIYACLQGWSNGCADVGVSCPGI